MQASLTLTSGANTSLEFTLRGSDASGMITWTGISPQGDLAGVPVLTRATVRTKAGIVSRAIKLVVPFYNPVLARYEGTVQARIVLNAPATVPLSSVLSCLELVASSVGENNSSCREDFVNGQ